MLRRKFIALNAFLSFESVTDKIDKNSREKSINIMTKGRKGDTTANVTEVKRIQEYYE